MKTAVVGAGHIAKQHLRALQVIEGLEIVICDRSPVTAEATAERFGVDRWYSDYAAMLAAETPAVVHVTTPADSHVPLTKMAIDAGAHAFVEKPIATRYSEWASLRDHAAGSDRWVMEDHNYLFNPTVRHVLSLIENGDFGDVVHAEVLCCLDILSEDSPFVDANAPHPALRLPGGAIADFLTHLASLAWRFVGPHRQVRSTWAKRGRDSLLPYDEMRALVAAERGTALLSFSSHSQPDAFWVRVYGTKMTAQINLFEESLRLDRLRAGPSLLTPLLNGLAAGRSSRRGALTSLKRKLADQPGAYAGLWEMIRCTYEAVRSGAEPPIGIQQIDQVNRLVADLTAEGCRL